MTTRLLINRTLFAAADNITTRLAPCRKSDANPLTLDGDTYWKHDNLAGMIRFLPQRNQFATNAADGAVSDDGIVWRRDPGAGHLVQFLTDDPDPDPARRYKRAFHIEGTEGRPTLTPLAIERCRAMGIPAEAGIGVSWSADGIDWRSTHPILKTQRQFTDLRTNQWGGGDGYNHVIYAPDLHKYVCYVRTNIDRGAYGGRKERAVSRMESEDFIHWTDHEICLRPYTDIHHALGDGKYDFYHLPVFRHASVYLSIVSAFRWPSDTVHLWLAWSPDSRHWEVLCEGQDFIPQGKDREKDAGCNFAFQEPVFVGDEMRIYYGGSEGRHNAEPERTSSLHLATFPRDRFAGIEPDRLDQPATLALKPLEITNDAMTLNADAARGEITVALHDEFGRPLDGFAKSRGIRSDSVRHEVQWEKPIASLRGQKAVVVFNLRHAALYALTF